MVSTYPAEKIYSVLKVKDMKWKQCLLRVHVVWRHPRPRFILFWWRDHQNIPVHLPIRALAVKKNWQFVGLMLMRAMRQGGGQLYQERKCNNFTCGAESTHEWYAKSLNSLQLNSCAGSTLHPTHPLTCKGRGLSNVISCNLLLGWM